MRKKFINSSNNLKNYNEKITKILLPIYKHSSNDINNFNYSNRTNIRSKYKNLKNISKIKNYREILKNENSAISPENQINKIKVNKNEALILKIKLDNDNNNFKSNYLKTENDIDKEYKKYRELKNKNRNDNKDLYNREESITTNKHSKFLFYKRLKVLRSLSNNFDEVKQNENEIDIKDFKTPDEKKICSTHKIFRVNLNFRNNRFNNRLLYSSEGRLKPVGQDIGDREKDIGKDKDKENKETKVRTEKKTKKEIKEKIENKEEICKNTEKIIKININNKYKKRLGLTKSIENNKNRLINVPKIKKSIFKRNYIFEINPSLHNVSNAIENFKTSINENIQIENNKSDKYEIIGKDIIRDKELFERINKRLKKILSKYNIPSFNLGHYNLLKSIGEGTYGKIYEVINRNTEKKYAIKKMLSRSIEKLEQLLMGFEISNSNPHENILNILGIYIKCLEKTKYVLYILMDLAKSDWDNAIKKRAEGNNYYTENELIKILKQISSALVYLQKDKNIAHRDIKPENILIFDNNIYKLCDFGEAKICPDLERTNSLRGTKIYMSPILYDCLQNNTKKVKHNIYKSDVFSFGYCFLYAACLNYNLIHSIRDLKFQGLVSKILNKFLKQRYSEDFVELISKMISIDENERPDFIQLEKLLKEKYSE